jgi:plasmid stabilization system protein ParE
MLSILWRAEAQADLAAILEYIAERNPQSAFDLYDGIERLVSQLPHHPYLYRLCRRFKSRTAYHECAVVKMKDLPLRPSHRRAVKRIAVAFAGLAALLSMHLERSSKLIR